MIKRNGPNERVKRQYLHILKETKGRDEASLDAVAKAIDRFEEHSKHRDFKKFHVELARAFKANLTATRNARTGELLSASTIHSTLAALKAFFVWLAQQPGYRSRIKLADAEYFNAPDNLSRVATARRYKACPTVNQVRAMIEAIPVATEIQQRDRALIAFALLSGARDRAIISFRLKHIDVENELIEQDARDVRTTRAKTFTTWFFPVGDDIRKIVIDWVVFLREQKGFDEAHRSQYGFRAKIEKKTGEIAYGFAKYLRDALPNASFIGFTGTPIEKDDVNTPAVFGEYIDVYDISRGVEDGATVPIYYESRLARIELPDAEKPKIDAEIEELTEDEAITEQERIKRKWATVEAFVGSENRLAMVAADLVRHFEDRVAAMDGKAMVVCMSRRICVALYDQIVALRPAWHRDDDAAGVIKVVMTGSAADPQTWQPRIGTRARRDLLAKRAKDPLKLVIVRDMWLTGFDAPSMHTMYVDKPMKGHGLMQAIARVNRVFRDKPVGLVVDYIGIAQNLKNALRDYSGADQRQAGIDEAEAVAVLLEKYEVVKAMYYGFDYERGLAGTPHERLAMLAEAMEWILGLQHEAAAKETTEAGKRRENRRYQDAVLTLSKAFALASASDAARDIRDDVVFFQTVRAALVRPLKPPGRTARIAILPSSRFWIGPSFPPKLSTSSPPPESRLPTFPFSPTNFWPRSSNLRRRTSRWKRSGNCSMTKSARAARRMSSRPSGSPSASKRPSADTIRTQSARLRSCKS
jgi:site-specific recombinase XerD